jgi:hypothetical protein
MSAKSVLRNASAALGMVILASRAASAATSKLLVFLHVAAKQRALQSELEAALPGVAVTAVGRVADFERALRAGHDAVLTLPVVLAANGLNPDLRGFRQGASHEKYSLMAADMVPDPAKVGVVGALDLLGREGTTNFVHGVLGTNPRVERVTKVEDLLPLLQMRRVEAILLPSRLLAELRAASRLNLTQWELATKVGLPALAKQGAAGAQIMAQVSKLPAAMSKSLGVEEWR